MPRSWPISQSLLPWAAAHDVAPLEGAYRGTVVARSLGVSVNSAGIAVQSLAQGKVRGIGLRGGFPRKECRMSQDARKLETHFCFFRPSDQVLEGR